MNNDPRNPENSNSEFGSLSRRARPTPVGTPVMGSRAPAASLAANIGSVFFIVPTDNAGLPGLEREHRDRAFTGKLVTVITGSAMPAPKFEVGGEIKIYAPNRFNFYVALWPIGGRLAHSRRASNKTQGRRTGKMRKMHTRKHRGHTGLKVYRVRGGRRMHIPDNSFVYKFMKMYGSLRPLDLEAIDYLYTRERRFLRDAYLYTAQIALEDDVSSGGYRFNDDSVTLGPELSRYIRSYYQLTPEGYVKVGALLDHLHGYEYPRD